MEEEELGKVYDAHLARRLGEYVRPYWGTVALSVVFLMGSAMLQTAGPWLTRRPGWTPRAPGASGRC